MIVAQQKLGKCFRNKATIFNFKAVQNLELIKLHPDERIIA